MTTIEFTKDFPEEFKSGVQERLKLFLPLINRYVTRLRVHFSSTDEDAVAAVSVSRQYHFTSLSLNADFFKESYEESFLTLAHELSHIFTDPINKELHALIESFVPQVSEEYAFKRLTHLMEELTDAFGHMTLALVTRVDANSCERHVEDDEMASFAFLDD